MKSEKAHNFEAYVSDFLDEVKSILREMRETILKATPHAEESISYQMPAFKTNGKPLVYFAGFKNHIGFYALPSGHSQFAKELSGYKQGKGSVQFPLTEPIPFDLVYRITKFRDKENL